MAGKKKAKKAPKIGRPTAFKPEYVEQTRKMCMVGATDAEMAEAFGVGAATLSAWKLRIPEFREALKAKVKADARVTMSLYRRALGYSHDAVKIFADPKTGAEKIIQYVEHYPPDTTACIFWLKNRQKDQWREKIEHTGPDGGPIEVHQTWTFGGQKVTF